MRPCVRRFAPARVTRLASIASFLASPEFLSGFLASLLLPVLSVDAQAASTGFVENRGQVDPEVLYYVPGSTGAWYFTRDAVVVDLSARASSAVSPARRPRPEPLQNVSFEKPGKKCAVWIRFEGANRFPGIEARGRLEIVYHFLFGNDPSRWRSSVRAYREIVYHDLWPGVDLVFRQEDGRITCESAASSSADTGAISFTYEGADRVVEGANGGVRVETGVGAFVLSRPDTDGRHGFSVTEETARANTVGGFAAIDNPDALLWSTFLGGGDLDSGVDLAIDPTGNVIVMGETYSTDFPITPGAYDVDHNGWVDVFVAKMSSDGSSVFWATYLGSSDAGVADIPVALALDPSGNPVVSGYSSTGFPVTAGAYDTSWNGGDDLFVTKLSSNGSTLLWSTMVGGTDYEFPSALVLDPSGKAVVAGATYSVDFPTTPGSYDVSYSSGGDVFVAKLSSDGTSLLWSTFVGGGEGGTGSGLVLDSSGNVVVTGYASSGTFPTTPGAYDPTWNGRDDVFVAKLSSGGSSLLWGTFLGGSANDEGMALALGPSGTVVVAGNTGSSDFPATPGAYDWTWNGGDDVFIAALTPDGSSVVWNTFLGGSNDDRVWDLALDSYGCPIVTGLISASLSSDFPTTYRTFDGSFNGGGLDGFVSALWSDGGVLVWSTFLGGSGIDEVHALALDSSGDPVLVGVTDSPDFPTTPGAYHGTLNGNANDVFVVHLASEDPTGIPGDGVSSLTSLLPCAPNPFARTTLVRYSLARDADVELTVFDVLGRVVSTLDEGWRSAGPHSVMWDGRNGRGQAVAGGVYFARLRAGGDTFEQKITVVH